ncbi:prepilin-type N-terminal cleavage/methylation domain-containing protein [Vibrio coralliirubri]|uniref:type II secretion system protein n=1 Tax=Vibrio coralliirubri TaxID=1516159 RepID=UPI0022842C06|nr:prepilin-type N-terminal cleavage/methylation domain-containing protein [Vibrio coralliirubri]MCY9861212.1 prepilin-type N-terminal cleavage/methylation domain-containing protein [Vibrio coralliirubri]
MKRINGFTLIELMTILVIIGVGYTIIMPMFIAAKSHSENEGMCSISIGDSSYTTSNDHCESLRLYIESTIIE